MEELKEILSKCDAAILYAPLASEVDYRERSFPLAIPEQTLMLPASMITNPFEWAIDCTEKFKHAKPFLLIPGVKFDLTGTRTGKGGGWYDRFLSAVPSTWPRVGVCLAEQLSPTPLVRESWDQPVDWLVVKNGSEWSVHETKLV